jgi:flavin prenyltransferase
MRIIIAMTGATGAVYGVSLFVALRELGVETHLVLSRWAEVTIVKETGRSIREIASTASVVHSCDNQGASIASGSLSPRRDDHRAVPHEDIGRHSLWIC